MGCRMSNESLYSMDNIEKHGDIVLHLGYWDCGCEHNYIHPVIEHECTKCHLLEEDQPNSRFDEVKDYLIEIGAIG